MCELVMKRVWSYKRIRGEHLADCFPLLLHSKNVRSCKGKCSVMSSLLGLWQKTALEDNLSPFEHDQQCRPDVKKVIRPSYEELSKGVLVERCLCVFSQNLNESLNYKTWKIHITYFSVCIYNRV